jgi:hypothetical protein
MARLKLEAFQIKANVELCNPAAIRLFTFGATNVRRERAE